MDWAHWRAEFPILSRKTYLNSCSLGALSHRAEARVRQFHEDWHNYGASAWYEIWLGRIAELRARVAAMLGASAAEIAITHSTSAALSSIASAIDYRQRNRVVVAELDFPTLPYQWLIKRGVEVVYARSDDGATVRPERFAELVDERTALVATSHVFYATGAIQDLHAIGDIAHRQGALFLVDAYQGIGQIPISLAQTNIDIYVAGPLKWMLGGPGLAYLYVRSDLISRLTPQIAGWFGAQHQFGFDAQHFEFHEDARRFELGTPALHMVHCALGGQEIIDEVTVPRIRERNAYLTEQLIDKANAAGFSIRGASDPAERSAIVMIALDDPAGAVNHLADRNIIIDHRPGHVRVSPHFYNLENELDLVLEELVRWRKR
ncbi:MAG TPA: aminotransferase class V-fold PLP-dependent enzyme [Longimicrobiales bacterium]